MHQQLALWPQENSQQPEVWQDLGSDAKKALIVVLARLIAKAVCPTDVTQTQEASHEN